MEDYTIIIPNCLEVIVVIVGVGANGYEPPTAGAVVCFLSVLLVRTDHSKAQIDRQCRGEVENS